MLKKVLHTGIQVDNLEKSIELYRSVGFEVMNRFEKPVPHARVALVQKGETAFELWEFEDQTHPHVAHIRNHVAFFSDDLEKDVKAMVNLGYKLVIPIKEGVTLRYAFVCDKAGAMYEIATDKTS